MSNWGIVYTAMKKGMAEVAFVGSECQSGVRTFFREFRPFVAAMGTQGDSHLPLLVDKTASDGALTIFVCYNKTCQRPVHNVHEAEEQLL
jgi:uncharacterized protein YyaL (SSP411 family)